MKNTLITTVLFDMDGVLIDSEGFWQQAEQEVFTSMGDDVLYYFKEQQLS